MEVPELVQVAEVMRQQTPNPAAHPPEAEPPLEVHSVEVTQVPVRPLEVEQASLGNWTQEQTVLKSFLANTTPRLNLMMLWCRGMKSTHW